VSKTIGFVFCCKNRGQGPTAYAGGDVGITVGNITLPAGRYFKRRGDMGRWQSGLGFAGKAGCHGRRFRRVVFGGWRALRKTFSQPVRGSNPYSPPKGHAYEWLFTF